MLWLGVVRCGKTEMVIMDGAVVEKRVNYSLAVVNITNSQFLGLQTDELYGGAYRASRCFTAIEGCLFRSCWADYGGSLYSTYHKSFLMRRTLFVGSRANRFGSFYADGVLPEIRTDVVACNVTDSAAQFIGAIRVEECRPVFTDVGIFGVRAGEYGAIWDWCMKPQVAEYRRVVISNSTTQGEAAGITFFHWMSWATVDDCVFRQGSALRSPTYIYVYSAEVRLNVTNTRFDLPRSEAIGEHAQELTPFELNEIRIENCSFGQRRARANRRGKRR